MTQRVRTIYIDDVSGAEFSDGETLKFSWRGVAYAIDLSEANVKKFEKAMAPYLKVARRDKAPSTPTATAPKGKNSRADREQLARIREWAQAEGLQVSERGRIAYEVREAYEQAHPEALAG